MKNFFPFLAALLLIALALPTQAQRSDTRTLATENGDLTVHAIQHGTLALTWNGQTIYVDPTGGADAFSELSDPDIIFITHPHGDHLSTETLQAIDTENATLIVPQSVADKLDHAYGKERVVLANGDSTQTAGVAIMAVPMYNLPPSDDAYHPKGWGNGYILTMGGKKIYISGDTEDVPEMRNLQNIDMAFVCMNLPYTMNVEQAADAVLDFSPDIVYPYHYRGQDTETFKKLVNAENKDIEVRLLDWYQ